LKPGFGTARLLLAGSLNGLQRKSHARKAGFEDVVVKPHEFLHPAVPKPLIPVAEAITVILESLPVIRQIAGSLFIKGRKP